SNPIGLSPPRREAALPYTNVLAAVATIKISANATAVDLSPNDTSFQVQTRTKQRRLVPRASREISVFRASVLAIAIASMSIEIEIRNICRAALSCGIIGILPCCRGSSLPRLAHNTNNGWLAAGSVPENHANGPHNSSADPPMRGKKMLRKKMCSYLVQMKPHDHSRPRRIPR